MKSRALYIIVSLPFILFISQNVNACDMSFNGINTHSLHLDFPLRSDGLLKTDTSNNKYIRFYNFLVKERYPFSMLGTPTEFTAKIKIESHARRLYRGLRKEGYSVAVLGTEEQFVKKFCK